VAQDNIFEWHFTIRGPRETEFEGGVYHGRILLPAEYPYKPPDIVFLTVRRESPSLILIFLKSTRGSVCLPGWYFLARSQMDGLN
jgi:ubiquitin-conjugating enzyme E2 J1